MSIKKNHTNENDENKIEIRPLPLYGILVCGIIIISIGVYLTITAQITSGFIVSRYSGAGMRSINGPSTIVLGVAMCVFPVWAMLKRNKPNK